MKVLALATTALLLACGNGMPQFPHAESTPAPVNGSASRKEVPSDATLCKLQVGVSSPDDAVRVLGKPESIDDDGRYTDMFYYYQDRYVTLYLAFDKQLLDSAVLENSPYPGCWRQQ